MDQELREYLDGFSKAIDARFGSIERQLQEFREETAQRFDRVEGRLDRVEGRLDTVETGIRHTNVLFEGLRGEVQLLAEGVDTANGRLDRLEQKVDRLLEEERADRKSGDLALDGRIRGLEKPRG